MTDKTYPYDPDLPYVVEMDGVMVARTHMPQHANWIASGYIKQPRIIDTTPKPRVPDDAEFITWTGGGRRYAAFRNVLDTWNYAPAKSALLEDLPGVTPETVFTVLDERKSDD